jgi:hypothetical protein
MSLSRTELPTAAKVHLAAAAVCGQGQYGALSTLARQFDVSRPTVYRAASAATEVLSKQFNAATAASEAGWQPVVVTVDYPQLTRAVVALRGTAPNSLRRSFAGLVPRQTKRSRFMTRLSARCALLRKRWSS